MPAIMCAPILRKALSRAGEPRARAHPFVPRVRRPLLGNWAATLIRAENTDLVVVLNERTYLTVVFPLTPIAAFRRAFADALTSALLDHDVPDARIPAECGQVETARLMPLRDAVLRSAIDTAGFIAGIEVACCDSLREVQWNVNQFPHERLAPYVPTQHVRLLFGGRNRLEAAAYSRRVSRTDSRDCVDALLRTRAASERIAASAAMMVPAILPRAEESGDDACQ